MMVTRFTCPVDGERLVPVERQGIEIDHCPECRGVWLDRGELDKIIERSTAAAPPPPQPAPAHAYDPRQAAPAHYGHDHRGHKRRKSFLEELFD
ncbi:zf-TFIIB domain-containing protein [Sphingomonas sp.]|uniref:TFIIB-type zinc ribbon-containing protein n=1 Tax=Sphingomonas sp. TaxID=28214 RepID=UPI001B0E95B4|nr:zf-TFIIB domain-containing protein [Sphingomonas sp.]MBO9713356.1 zf-TFIIB domain-containing protein [Sphingomonas sp.]